MLPRQFKPYHGASFIPNSLRAFGKSELFFLSILFNCAAREFVDYKLRRFTFGNRDLVVKLASLT